MTRTSSKAVAGLDSALRAWSQAAQDISRKASASVRELVAGIEEEIQARARRVAALESEVAVTRGDARARLARELQEAATGLERGRRGLRQAKDAERRVQVLQKRISEATNTRIPRASTVLKHKLAALEQYSAASLPRADAAPAAGTTHGPELSFVQKAGLTVAAITGFIPSPSPGLAAHDANLQQAGDTAVSRSVNPDETAGLEGVIYQVVEHQVAETHQLSQAYEEQELSDAQKRTRHLGEPGSHG